MKTRDRSQRQRKTAEQMVTARTSSFGLLPESREGWNDAPFLDIKMFSVTDILIILTSPRASWWSNREGL